MGASLPRSAPQTADGPHLRGFSPTGGIRPPAIPEATQQAMLNLKVQNLRAKFAQQQQQIEKLTAQLKENAEQIQKASVQLEMSKPVTKVVANKN